MLLRSFKRKKDCAAALVELLITFPVALTIVLSSVHLSDVIRESAVAIEAARHGARSVSAASATAAWANINNTQGPQICPLDTSTSGSNGNEIAFLSTCNFLNSYFGGRWNNEYSKWQVSSQISSAGEDVFAFRFISVTLTPTTSRGLIDFYIPFIDIRPQSTAVFPIMQVGIP